jgi:transcriptional regulator with XRE-family HTH domain
MFYMAVSRDSERFGREVRRLRLDADLTQAELGDLIGLERESVSNLERGKVPNPSDGTLKGLERHLKLSRLHALELLGKIPEIDDKIIRLILEIDALPEEEHRAAVRQLPVPVRKAIRRIMRALLDEASEQLQE